jgi:hypothetical protein
MSDLNTAIQLIRQGNTAQAQKILEPIVRTETNNVPAWLWYAQTWPSQEMRLKVLVACLKFNPGNEQVLQALRLVRGKLSAQSNPPVEAPASQAANQTSFARVAEEPVEIPPTFAHILSEQPQPDESRVALNWDELEQASAPAAPVAPQSQPVESGSAFNWDELEQASAPVAPVFADQFFTESQPVTPEVKAPRHSYPFYKVWWIALTKQNVRAYADLLDDPEAGTGRVVEWTIYVSLINAVLGLVIEFYLFSVIQSAPEFGSPLGKLLSGVSQNTLIIWAIVGALITPIFAVLSLLFISWLQYIVAVAFGGIGTFRHTVYAIGSFVVPLQVVSLIITIPFALYLGTIFPKLSASSTPASIFPSYLFCLAPLFLLYILIVNIRALRATHQLGIWNSLATIVVAFIAQTIASCCLNFVLSSILGKALLSIFPGADPNLPTY